MERPKFDSALFRFNEIDLLPDKTQRRPPVDIARIIGGKVQFNFETNPKKFANACAIRLSYVLNKNGVTIPHSAGTGSGKDRNWYFYRVVDITAFVEKTFGPAEIDITLKEREKLNGQVGLYAIEGTGFSDATGHMSLWNGAAAADHDYLDDARFKPERIRLWKLPSVTRVMMAPY